MCFSGRLVMKNLTGGTFGTDCPNEEHGRFWFFVSALVEGVDDDHGGDIRRLERSDEEHLHLVLKRLVHDVWI